MQELHGGGSRLYASADIAPKHISGYFQCVEWDCPRTVEFTEVGTVPKVYDQECVKFNRQQKEHHETRIRLASGYTR